MSKRIAVLGASGFLGRRIVRILSSAGADVVSASRRDEKVEGAYRHVTAKFDHPEHFVDLLDTCDAVVHTASTSTPGTSSGHALREVDSNLRVTAALLEGMQQTPSTPLIYISSGGSVYSDCSGQLSSERSPVHPRSYHGAIKLASEWLISAWCDQFNARALAIRPSNVYGPGQPERPGFGVIPAAFGCLTRQEPLTIWGDGSASRDYVYIDDVARLVDLAIDSDLANGLTIVNACSSTSTSLNKLLDTIEEVAGSPIIRTYHLSRRVDASHIAMDNARAFDLFGWRPSTSLRQGLAEAWATYTRTSASGFT